jgi:hypothetical protein
MRNLEVTPRSSEGGYDERAGRGERLKVHPAVTVMPADGGADGSGAPSGSRNGNYKHGRYTAEVAATRRWLREATHLLRDLNKRAE